MEKNRKATIKLLQKHGAK